MALSDAQIQARIEALEEEANELQVALNNLATRRMVNTILALRQNEIDTLQSQLQSVTTQLQALQAAVTGTIEIPPTVEHGGLTGLGDDDHLQYHTDTRGDARYVQIDSDATLNTLVVSGITASGIITSGITASYLDLPPNGPNPEHFEGRVFWDDDHKSLAYYNENNNVTVNIGQELLVRVLNKTGVTITNGQAVYVTGGQGHTPIIELAIADKEESSMKVLGIATHDIDHNARGYVTTAGAVHDLDTSMWPPGTHLFLSPTVSGALTDVKPSAPDHLVTMGIVIDQHGTEGHIYANIIPGFEVEELHNVTISGLQDQDYLVWNETDSLWKPTRNTRSSTTEALAFDLDPTNGSDPTTKAIAASQADVDALQATLSGLSFKTLAGIQRVLPHHIAFDITVTIPDGSHTIGQTDLGDWSLNTIDPTAKILVQSTSITTQVAGTSVYTVDSVTASAVVLASSPGWGADARQGDFIKIITGTEAGKYRSVVKSPDDLTYEIAAKRWLAATETFEFHEPAVTLSTSTDEMILTGFGQFWSTRATPHFEFLGIEIAAAKSFKLARASIDMNQCRVRSGDYNVQMFQSWLRIGDSTKSGGAFVLDGTNASFTSCLFAQDESFIRVTDSNASIAVVQTTYGLMVRNSLLYVFAISFADMSFAHFAYGYNARVQTSPGFLIKQYNVGTMFGAVQTGTIHGPVAGSWGSFVSGDTADIYLDQQTFTWAEFALYDYIEGPAGSVAWKELF